MRFLHPAGIDFDAQPKWKVDPLMKSKTFQQLVKTLKSTKSLQIPTLISKVSGYKNVGKCHSPIGKANGFGLPFFRDSQHRKLILVVPIGKKTWVQPHLWFQKFQDQKWLFKIKLIGGFNPFEKY